MGFTPTRYEDIKLEPVKKEETETSLVSSAFMIGVGVAIVLFAPWWLVLAAGAGLSIPWYKRWRFNKLKASDKRFFANLSDITEPTLGDMMYLGLSKDGTIRWWYSESYIYPQAVDDGTVYWDQCIKVNDPIFLKHLNGFFEMGNEWPAYYKATTQKNNSKSKKRKKNEQTIAASPSDMPRADYMIAESDPRTYARTAAMASDAPLLQLISTVKELEQDATGRCPTINFEGLE